MDIEWQPCNKLISTLILKRNEKNVMISLSNSVHSEFTEITRSADQFPHC